MTKHLLPRALSLLLGTFAAVALATSAGATGTATSGPIFQLNGEDLDGEALNCRGDGKQVCTGEAIEFETGLFLDWQIAVDPDPSVILLFAIQNNTDADQTYVFSALLPVPAQGPELTLNGSVGGSLTDVDGDGATLTDNGNPIYTSIIDGSFVETLLDPPQAFTAGAFDTEVIGPASFGPTLFPGPVDTFIGVTIQFTLSAGDLASFTSVFNVVPVPEPGTLLLLGSGLAGLVTFGRKRSA